MAYFFRSVGILFFIFNLSCGEVKSTLSETAMDGGRRDGGRRDGGRRDGGKPDGSQEESPFKIQFAGHDELIKLKNPGSDYHLNLSTIESEVQIIPFHSSDAEIWIAGDTVALGEVSKPVVLKFGINSINIKVVLGSSEAQYTVAVDRGGKMGEQVLYGKSNGEKEKASFGQSVAVDGDRMVVGAYLDSSVKRNAGAVFVFHKTGGVWEQEAVLSPNIVTENEHFGQSVAIKKGRIVVGAPCAPVNSEQRPGSVYTFELRADNSWHFTEQTMGSLSGRGDRFGISVALENGVLAVGAVSDDTDLPGISPLPLGDSGSSLTSSNSGAVYLFDWDTRTKARWTERVFIKAENPDDDSLFGFSVDLHGETMVVGARQARMGGLKVGAVYVYSITPTSTMLEDTLHARSPSEGDHFGFSVAVEGDIIAVGAIYDHSGVGGVRSMTSDDDVPDQKDSGAVHIYERKDGWRASAVLKVENPDEGDWFGYSVSLLGGLLAVGAVGKKLEGPGKDISAGAVYLFRYGKEEGKWEEDSFLTASVPDHLDQFGYDVALSSDLLLVGARGESSNAVGFDGDQTNNESEKSGAIYVFQ